jgi:hypothetical protein
MPEYWVQCKCIKKMVLQTLLLNFIVLYYLAVIL